MGANTQAEALKNLERERDQTIERLASLREALKEEVETATDEGYPDVYEREKNLALLQHLEQKLESVERALRLQQKGGYGICERCEEAIDPERLGALPDTTLCLRCKQEIERLARRGSAVDE
jgi:RNA polymerase-binding transcription factor DksA